MSAYYKKIDGKNYDRAMIEKAESSIKGKGDGRISLSDARNLIKLIKDGGRITDIEKKTLSYILENYKFTDTAIKYIEKTLTEALTPEPETVSVKEIEKSDRKKGAVQTFSFFSKKVAILISLLIIIILILIFAFVKIFQKSKKPDILIPDKKDEVVSVQRTEAETPKTETAVTTSDVAKTVEKQKAIHGNEYIVKENDNLIKISIELFNDYTKWHEIYNLNKDKVDKPSIIFPGQVLKLPEKQNK
jgi:nucleoid-associated protein YgaU